ncbi:actin-1, putative [Entamoeba invadens IP1]|uniref:Actin-1, putative n=1 Tax=Entamoeba invadens IP1 TaxID=370355 RepID=A0A0A1UDM0_ENTIV|nr:actin-1, putative [Entamoeba invadens IP1]ELP94656.1 actin-1, putative [Entamoeba invadens IP1]|eukprot:XP_004261427.1 actin-1, putative [Entamoeba invadens IP1]
MSFFGKPKFSGNEFMVRCQCAQRRIDAQKRKYVTNSRSLKKQILTFLENNEREKAYDKCAILVQEDYKCEALEELVDIIDELQKNSEVIASQRICPLELKAACGAILYASPYFPDHTEMMEMRNMLIDKFGKTFPEDCVNSKVVSAKLMSRLSSRNIDSDVIEYYLDNIAKENNLQTTTAAVPTQNPEDALPADASRCELSKLPEGTQYVKYVFGVLTRNSTGNIRKGGDKVQVFIAGPNNAKIVGDVKDLHDGTYDLSFDPPYEGDYLIAVYINDKQMNQVGKLHIKEGSMVDLNQCLVEGNGLNGGYVNEKQFFTVFAKDQNGRTVGKGGEPFVAYVAGPGDVRIVADKTDLMNGQYDFCYIPPVVGNYAIAIYHNQTQVKNVFQLEIKNKETFKPQFVSTPEVVHQPQEVKSVGVRVGKPGEHFIIDVGSCIIKAGFESAGNPTLLTANVVGENLHKANMLGTPPIYVGDDAIGKRGILTLTYPMQKDPVDFEKLGRVLQYTMERAKGHPVVVVMNPLAPLQMKINMCEMLFKEEAESVRFVDEALAVSAYYKKPSCIVVDIGGMMSWAIPVVNGVVYKEISEKMPIAGVKCTEVFATLLTKEGVNLGSTSSEKVISRQIKECVGYIANDGAPAPSLKYDMPDGTLINVGNSRTQCFEPLFNPQLCSMSCNGLSQMVEKVLRSINGTTNEVVLVGGGAMIKGIKERIEGDIMKALNFKINVTADKNAKYAMWMGAGMLDKQNAGTLITAQVWKNEGALCLDD